MTDYAALSPAEARSLFRSGELCRPTAGFCAGYAQANLVVLPSDCAYDFLLYTQRNPKACPVLEVADRGSRSLRHAAPGADLARDLPKYRLYERGVLVEEFTSVGHLWRGDFVAFLIGCSFSFEAELLEAGIPVRHIEEGRNVPMYLTDIDTEPAGIFSGKMVVSMRPIPRHLVVKAVQISSALPAVHGAPIHLGDGGAIGIADLSRPDFGDAVEIREGELPVFWPCGVTPQAALMNAKPAIAITHAPGHMFITDMRNIDLKYGAR